MDTPSLLMLRCPNKECSKPFKMYRPAKAGIYKITCPHCTKTFPLNIPEKAVASAGQPVTPPQAPDNSAAKLIEMRGQYLVGVKYEILCPHCQKAKMNYTPSAPGTKGFRCTLCKGPIAVSATEKTNVIDVGECNFTKGRLRQLKRLGKGDAYPLPIGRTVVGRADESQPSDFGIRGDSCISRRSLEIEVKLTEKGYTFKLTVLKATNPVMHNNEPLKAKESVYLNFGDHLTLGKTNLIFEECQ